MGVSSKLEMLEKVTIYFACMNGGDGSVSVQWFTTAEAANKAEEDQDEGWGEPCTGSVETFRGSDIHKSALKI